MGIFISYRRADSQEVVGRMYDRLITHFPLDSVFRDLDSLPIGKPFPQALDEAVTRAHVALIVIGPTWLSITDADGRRRLDNPADFVRLEVEKALGAGLPVVPVLVSHASMPNESDLPESLRPLVYRHGVSVRPDPDFHRDMDRLIAKLDHLLAKPPVAAPQPQAPRPPSSPEYFCYVSRQKVDQLHAQIAEDQPGEGPPASAGAADEAGLSARYIARLFEDASYGLRGVVQRERKVKAQYLDKLRRVVAHLAAGGPIPSLEGLLSAPQGGRAFFHYRGEFRPVTPLSGPVPSETLVTLKSQAGKRALLLDCSLRNFSEGNDPDGSFHVHSGNHRFFAGQIGLWLQTVAVYFDATADEVYGSPLFLKLGMRPASATELLPDHMPVL